MGSGEFVHAKWTLGIAAACVAALGLFSCSGGDVAGISILPAGYDIVYEFDRRFAADGIDNDGINGVDDAGESCLDTCLDTNGDGICEGRRCTDCDDLVGGGPATDCTNNIDDDSDGFTDEADCTNGIDDDGDGSTDEREAVPTPCPPAGIDELRLELAHFDGAVARFVLRADNFALTDAWRIRFGLTFNSDLFGYTYPSPGMESHSLEYPGAVPWEKVPLPGGGMKLHPGPFGDGLADLRCNGCCIEWTDYSCAGPGKKEDTCFQDINPRDVKLCIKRSCSYSVAPLGGSCDACRVDCCDCQDLDPLSRRCRIDIAPPGMCCHNTCDQPLFTELEGNPDTDKQTNICCTAKAALQIEDNDCEAMACDDCAKDECCDDCVTSDCTDGEDDDANGLIDELVNGQCSDCETTDCTNCIDDDGDGNTDESDCTNNMDDDEDTFIDETSPLLAFSGATPNGVVATIPLWVKAAREFDDFRFFFLPGESTVYGYDSDFSLAESFTVGKGTVVAVD